MKASCVLLILIAWVCVAPASAQSPEEIDAALKADLRGDMKTVYPSRVGPAYGRGRIEIEPPESRTNRPPSGSISVEQLRHKPPKRAQRFVARSARFSQTGQHERASRELQNAIARDPDYAEAHERLGVEYAQLEHYDQAQAELCHSLLLDPASWSGHYNLALVLYHAGNFTAAEQSASRALGLTKAHAQVHMLLGWLLWQRGEADGLEYLQYAARTMPEARQLLDGLQGK